MKSIVSYCCDNCGIGGYAPLEETPEGWYTILTRKLWKNTEAAVCTKHDETVQEWGRRKIVELFSSYLKSRVVDGKLYYCSEDCYRSSIDRAIKRIVRREKVNDREFLSKYVEVHNIVSSLTAKCPMCGTEHQVVTDGVLLHTELEITCTECGEKYILSMKYSAHVMPPRAKHTLTNEEAADALTAELYDKGILPEGAFLGISNDSEIVIFLREENDYHYPKYYEGRQVVVQKIPLCIVCKAPVRGGMDMCMVCRKKSVALVGGGCHGSTESKGKEEGPKGEKTTGSESKAGEKGVGTEAELPI